SLQRLGVLAPGDGRGPHLDRRVARRDPRRDAARLTSGRFANRHGSAADAQPPAPPALCYGRATNWDDAHATDIRPRGRGLGNSIHLEHVNVQIPDQRLAMLFYVSGLGLTRDPYLMVHDSNMWINAGRSQFHLPTGTAQVLRGHTGIVVGGREALLARLAS